MTCFLSVGQIVFGFRPNRIWVSDESHLGFARISYISTAAVSLYGYLLKWVLVANAIVWVKIISSISSLTDLQSCMSFHKRPRVKKELAVMTTDDVARNLIALPIFIDKNNGYCKLSYIIIMTVIHIMNSYTCAQIQTHIEKHMVVHFHTRAPITPLDDNYKTHSQYF